jgi:UDP-perosamine 4-acetyltransferase
MAQTQILIIGTGGHARVMAAAITGLKRFKVKGYLDLERLRPREQIFGRPVLGVAADARVFRRKGLRHAAVAVGDNRRRKMLVGELKALGYILPAIIHRQAMVDSSAEVEAAAFIGMGAKISAQAHIGEGAIINTGSIIDHESVIAPFVHAAPGSIVAGRVTVGEGAFLGMGAKVIDHLAIGAWATVGAGAVVLQSVPAGQTVYGVPAKPAA